MKLDKFTLLFLKNHIKQTWIAYFFLIISIIYIMYATQFVNLTGTQRIVEGISLSYIAAYMFYFFINLYPEYIKETQGIITIKNELNNITMNIREILSFFKSFSCDNCYKVNFPNSVIYVKEKNSKYKNFFNPREELNKDVYDLHKEQTTSK